MQTSVHLSVTAALFIVSASLTQCRAEEILWQLDPSGPSAPMTVKETAYTTSVCSMKCLESPHCSAFCYKVSTSECYLAVWTSSQVLSDTSGARCYSAASVAVGSGYCPTRTVTGYSWINNHCLKLYGTSEVCYQTARDTCLQDGGHLYYYKSLLEPDTLTSLLAEAGITSFSLDSIWVGADDQEVEGDWRWGDGSAVAAEMWQIGEPNDYGNNEDCAAVIVSESVLKMNDYPCGLSSLSFICQIDV